jgi:pyrimidine operon attenuation protein/uracil phosphoribosyltransferase
MMSCSQAAPCELLDYGRPAFIRLAVLVDRGHRELPIASDFCGMSLSTALEDRVRVDWAKRTVRIEASAKAAG